MSFFFFGNNVFQIQMTLLLRLFHSCPSHFLPPNNHSIETGALSSLGKILSFSFMYTCSQTIYDTENMHKKDTHFFFLQFDFFLLSIIVLSFFYVVTIVLINYLIVINRQRINHSPFG